MLFTTSRAVVRHRRGLLNRPTTRRQSTTSQATQAASTGASKAADAASSATSKASEGLSRVSSSAGSALSGVARGAGNTLSRIGGPAGRLVSFTECKPASVPLALYIESLSTCDLYCYGRCSKYAWTIVYANGNLDLAMIPPTIYYSRVGFELVKLVFQGQRMSPPYAMMKGGQQQSGGPMADSNVTGRCRRSNHTCSHYCMPSDDQRTSSRPHRAPHPH